MATETSESRNPGCVREIGCIFPILLIVGLILLFVYTFVIEPTLPEASTLAFVGIINRSQQAARPTLTPTLPAIAQATPTFALSATPLPTNTLEPTLTPVVTEEVMETETVEATVAPASATPEEPIMPLPPLEVGTPTPGLPATGGVLDLPLPQTGDVLSIASTPLPTVYAKASWPSGIELNDSDMVKLLLTTKKSQLNSLDVATATATPRAKLPLNLPTPTPLPRATSVSKAIDFAELCNVPSDEAKYQGFAIASLDGSAFDISPQGPQREALTKLYKGKSTITWAWTITPKRSGSHKVNLGVEIEWVPLGDIAAPIIQCEVWEDQELYISVKDPPLFVMGQISIAAIGMIFIGGFGTVFWGRIESWLNGR